MHSPESTIFNPDTQLRTAIVAEPSLGHASGVTNSVLRVAERLEEREYPATIICPGPAREEYSSAEVSTVPHVRLKGFNVGLATTNSVARRLEVFRPDVVHVASPFGPLGAAGIRAAAKLDIPCVAIYQTDMPNYLKRYMEELGHPRTAQSVHDFAARRVANLHNTATLNLAPSSTAREALLAYGANPEKVDLWGRGVDAKLFNPERRNTPEVAALREQLSPEGLPIVGYVGRLASEKRVGRLGALADLAAKVVIVGDGPERDALKQSLGDKAVFLGELRGNALANAYATFDIFAHTGTNETFGQTLQEAMASAAPVVAPAAGGPIDIVKNGKTGFLYEADDDGALRSSIATLVNDAEMRQAMGRAGRRAVEPRSWSSVCDNLIGYYHTVAK